MSRKLTLRMSFPLYQLLLLRLLVHLKKVQFPPSQQFLLNRNWYKVFGKPQGDNFEFFFTAANFLQYGDALRVVRAESGIVNAVAQGSAILIRDTDHYLNSFSSGQASVGE